MSIFNLENANHFSPGLLMMHRCDKYLYYRLKENGREIV